MILSVSSKTKRPFTITNVKDVWLQRRLYWCTKEKPLEINSVKFESETDCFVVYEDLQDEQLED